MPEYVIASTTDTQDAVNEAAGAVAEVAEGGQTEQPETDQVEAKTEDVAPEPQLEQKPEKPRVSKYDKRIAQLTREKHELAERLEALEARVSAATEPREEPQVAPPPQVQAQPQAKTKPVSSEFKTYDEYAEALADWKFDQRLAEMERQAAEQAAAEAQQKTVDAYQQRLAEAQDRYEDWNEVAERAGNMTIPPAASRAIIGIDNGPDVVYYLAKNPEAVKELQGLGPVDAATRIGVLSARLRVEESEPEPEPAPKRAADVRPITSAKPPIKTLAGRAASSVPLDQMDYRDYRKMRDEQDRKRWSNYR